MKNVIDFILIHWQTGIGLSSLIYEIIVRLFPTRKDWSLLNKIFKILDIVIPNFERDANGKLRRKKNIFKSILIFFVLISGIENVAAQNPNNQFNGMYWIDPGTVDTTLIKNTRTTLANTHGGAGAMFYDKTNDKYRIYDPILNVWVDWNAFNNGGGDFWPLTGTGTFTGNVIIDADGSDLLMDNIETFTVNSTGTSTIYLHDTFGSGFISESGLEVGSMTGTFTMHTGAGTGQAIDLTATGINIEATGDVVIHEGLGAQIEMSGGDIAVTTSTGNTYLTLASTGVELRTESDNGYAIVDASSTMAMKDGCTLIGNPNATRAGINVGSNAGAPGTLNNGDFFYNSTTSTNQMRANASTQNVVGSSTLVAGRINYSNGSALITDEAAFTYNSGTNTVLLSNVAGTATTSIFGGEAQYDNISNSDDLTINSAGIQITDGPTGDAVSVSHASDNFAVISTGATVSVNSIYFPIAGVSLSGATLRNISTVPAQILPAPGVGLYYEIISVNGKFDPGAVDYNFASPLRVVYSGDTGGAYSMDEDFVNTAGNKVGTFTHSMDAIGITGGVNEAINITSDSADATTGDGVLTITIVYAIRTF